MCEHSNNDADVDLFFWCDGIKPTFASVAAFWRSAFLWAISNQAEELTFRPTAEDPLVIMHQQHEYPVPKAPDTDEKYMYKVAARLIAGGVINLDDTAPPKPRRKGALRALISNSLERDLTGTLTVNVCKWRLFWSATCSPRRKMVRFVYLYTTPDDPTYRNSML